MNFTPSDYNSMTSFRMLPPNNATTQEPESSMLPSNNATTQEPGSESEDEIVLEH